MSKVAPPKIRIAAPGTYGAETFNFYQILTILAGLYIHLMENEQVEGYRVNWDHCSLAVLEQVGIAFDVWGLVQKQEGSPEMLPEDIDLIRRTGTLANRLVIVQEQLNPWVSVIKAAGLMIVIEGRIQVIFEQIVARNPTVMEKLLPTGDLMIRRAGWLRDIKKVAQENAVILTRNYAEPVSLV